MWELGRYLVLSASFIMGFTIWAEVPNWAGPIDSDEDRGRVRVPYRKTYVPWYKGRIMHSNMSTIECV